MIQYWVHRVDSTDDCQIAKKSGRNRALKDDQEEDLVKCIREYAMHRSGYSKIREKNRLFHITRRTVNNYGLRNGFKRYRAVKKPPLNNGHIEARRAFCEKWLQRPEDCKKLIIADEKLFHGRPTNNFRPVLRKKGERFLPEHIQPNLRPTDHSKCNIIIYIGPFGKGDVLLAENKNWFTADGTPKEDEPKEATDTETGEARVAKSKPNKRKAGRAPGFDGASYEDLLVNRMIPSIKTRISEWLYMQDNASIHYVKESDQTKTNVEKIFESEGVELVKFPARSPDLTPIENVLSLLSREYSNLLEKLKEDYLPKNKADTFGLVRRAWQSLDNEKVKKIYFSIADRLLAVRKIDGKNHLKL